ncbi:MAG: methyltransferase [Candidatus Heimdallarchaeota archaeon]|nr:methyltransferase [Candidatus Heimdallarchaeota archaeon]
MILKIKRKDLEIFLQKLKTIEQPRVEFEQYTTPARVAANLLWFAGVNHYDIFNKVVLDLGTGSGILAVGAAFLGAKQVIGIDIDFNSLKVAKENGIKAELNLQCDWICLDVRETNFKPIDTTIMNPPFGMRKESTIRDRTFLKTAVKFSQVIYSINPSAEETRSFFKNFCKKLDAEIDEIVQMNFEIPRQFSFHKKRKHIIFIDLYRILVQP